jgi:hypothetical protein
MNRSAFRSPTLVILTFIVVVSVAVTAARSQSRGGTGVQRTYDLPNARILSLDGTTVKVDTRTGAVFRLTGDASATGRANQWQQRVPPVTGSTSGMLDVFQLVEHKANGTFLHDVDGNRTWILTWRGNQNGQWREIQDAP